MPVLPKPGDYLHLPEYAVISGGCRPSPCPAYSAVQLLCAAREALVQPVDEALEQDSSREETMDSVEDRIDNHLTN